MITTEKKTLKVGKYVDTAHVDTVIRTYKQERWVHNSDRLGKEDSLSAWHSIEELEEFINTAKRHGADGIKIYFAAYPENYSEYPNMLAVKPSCLLEQNAKQPATVVRLIRTFILMERKAPRSLLSTPVKYAHLSAEQKKIQELVDWVLQSLIVKTMVLQ
jgi:hypothetical protein